MELETKLKAKRNPKSIDRAVITPDVKQKLNGFKKQVSETYGEFIKLNYTELVTLLVKLHADNLDPNELQYVCDNWYDEGRFIKWCYKVYCEAQERGEKITLDEITAKYRPQGSNRITKKIRKARKSKLAVGIASEVPSNFESLPVVK